MTRAEILAAKAIADGQRAEVYNDVQWESIELVARELLRLHDGQPWTSEPPTVPGWYWWKRGSESEPELVELRKVGGRLTDHANAGGFWLGPVEPADCATIAELRRERDALQAECERLRNPPQPPAAKPLFVWPEPVRNSQKELEWSFSNGHKIRSSQFTSTYYAWDGERWWAHISREAAARALGFDVPEPGENK